MDTKGMTASESKPGFGNAGELHQTAGGAHAPLTTNQGVALSDNQNSLKPNARGPILLEDFVLREKINHFDHERIPERIVHARGTGAHGFFELKESLAKYTTAKILCEVGEKTPQEMRVAEPLSITFFALALVGCARAKTIEPAEPEVAEKPSSTERAPRTGKRRVAPTGEQPKTTPLAQAPEGLLTHARG